MLKLYSRPIVSESLEVGPRHCYLFFMSPTWFWCAANVGNHWALWTFHAWSQMKMAENFESLSNTQLPAQGKEAWNCQDLKRLQPDWVQVQGHGVEVVWFWSRIPEMMGKVEQDTPLQGRGMCWISTQCTRTRETSKAWRMSRSLEGLKIRVGDELYLGSWPEEQGSGTQSRGLG